ncbi:MAG TPA: prephenate dehydrogenase/arogenate dehydrogenase family protein [Anaerolineaceae bacterium]|nr:prephenate dehydrogenase/arogenate dehydrogenase family protein [Anaerolineaceae bacterium]
MTVSITVVGLGQVGTSIGLALAQHKQTIVRWGTDREPTHAQKAQKLGGFDKIFYNLPEAVAQADVVILTLPVDEIRETLKLIVPELKEGATIIDTSPVKLGVAAWAKEVLLPDRYFVSMTPTINPEYLLGQDQDAARADLFNNSVMVITSLPGTDASAMDLVSDLTVLLGAKPYFADPYEADGLLAGSHIAPRLVAAAMVRAVAGAPGWREGKRVAGQAYAALTAPVVKGGEMKGFGEAAQLNRENVSRVLGEVMVALQEMRTCLDKGDRRSLMELLEETAKMNEDWWSERQSGEWKEDIRKVETPTLSQVLGRLIGARPKKKNGQ